MDDYCTLLNAAVPLEPLLGYLNFSTGKPDARFQMQFNAAYAWLADHDAAEPWKDLHEALVARLGELHASGVSAFRSTDQAEGVLRLAFAVVLPGYRRHHADLLFHLGEADWFQPFFLVRVVEAVLAQGGPWAEDERIVAGALAQLNDYVGHRPIAILESRPRAEPYDYERVRPIPLYLRGGGCAWGRYRELLDAALAILRDTDPAILQDACFDLELLDELALDPRAYDHNHPVNRRSNYVFGEWDPHQIDNQGRYRRFVLRQVTLDALRDRTESTPDLPQGELLLEAAATLAGTILMASCICGHGPAAHDSTATLTTLIPRVAKYRDAFYQDLLGKLQGTHAQRLREEAARTKQPFGSARQHLNQWLGRHRAAQLQAQRLALIFAAMGFPEASRGQAARIPAASIRMLSEIQIGLATARQAAERGDLPVAARLLPEIEALLHRGIAAGALPDPWNILGFQALFPLSQAQEDAVRDTRIDALIHVMGELFGLYDRLLCEAAGRGDTDLAKSLTAPMRRLASWWDRFASVEVSDVRHVHGALAVESAVHVAGALAEWHERGEAAADLAFWRERQESFRSPQAYARVVEALLRKNDYRATLALLVTWLGQAEQVSLQDGEYSFHQLALRWLLGSVQQTPSQECRPLIAKFFDYLEANAEDYWQVPRLELSETPHTENRRESPFEAAYEGVTYRDTTDDDEDSAVAEGGRSQGGFALEQEAQRLDARLTFLATVARLWQIAARSLPEEPAPKQAAWLQAAQHNYRQLLAFLDEIHRCPIPEGAGGHDAMIEVDRRRQVKEHLLMRTIDTSLATFMAIGTLQRQREGGGANADLPAWAGAAMQLEQAILAGDAPSARALLPGFLERFRAEPLLFKPWATGGQPRHILRARIAVQVLRALAATLPRVGLLTDTYQLLKVARAMEEAQPPEERGVTQFNELFETGFRAMTEAVAESGAWTGQELCHALEQLTGPCLILWVEHGQKTQLSVLETLGDESAWKELRSFVKRYGNDLFHHRFLAPGNLRGILHQGVGAYLDYLCENPDPLHPIRLIEELGRTIPRDRAVRLVEFVLRAVVDNYGEFKDYHQTATQSAYGENLYMLLDLLRLRAGYDRHAWMLRPLSLVHDTLVRTSHHDAALYWRERCAEHQRPAADGFQAQLAALEQAYGMRLATVAGRIGERFVKSLDLDRLCGLVEPAMAEAEQGQSPHFNRLAAELQAFAAQPTGVGLDVPQWLQRLELEVQRVRIKQSSLAVLAETWAQLARRRLSREELEQQVRQMQGQVGPKENEPLDQ